MCSFVRPFVFSLTRQLDQLQTGNVAGMLLASGGSSQDLWISRVLLNRVWRKWWSTWNRQPWCIRLRLHSISSHVFLNGTLYLPRLKHLQFSGHKHVTTHRSSFGGFLNPRAMCICFKMFKQIKNLGILFVFDLHLWGICNHLVSCGFRFLLTQEEVTKRFMFVLKFPNNHWVKEEPRDQGS